MGFFSMWNNVPWLHNENHSPNIESLSNENYASHYRHILIFLFISNVSLFNVEVAQKGKLRSRAVDTHPNHSGKKPPALLLQRRPPPAHGLGSSLEALKALNESF